MGCNVSVPDPPAVSPAPPVVHKSPPSAAPSSAPTKQNSSSSNGAVATMTIQVPRGARPGMVLQAKTPHGTLVQFKVPVGVAPGQTFQAQYPITNSNVIDEESKNQKSVATHLIPSYWTNVKIPGNTAFDQMVYIDRQQHDTFNTLLSESYFAKATRDRPCPRGSCPKTAGGCPCVQPGGSPGLPTQYIVRRVVRVEDSSMWAKYVERREAIAENRMMRGEMPLRSPDPPIKTDEVCDQYSQVFEQLDNELNEVYLWHGTNVRAALSIAANDFRVDLAGSNTGTMYGRGAYMAESCTKADEYATDEPGGYYEGVYAMLLCRVCLGKFYYTEHRNEEAGSKVKSGEYDSTLGDRAKSVGTFREFVVYDADAVYPEYVIIYSRVHEADDMQRIDTLGRWSFHMQLPVYWANCYKNPAEESFFEQYRVRTHTVQLLQKLLQSCYKQGKLKVKSARRVENSNVWNSYVQFKQQLNQQLGGFTNSFTPPHELDGDASSGHIMTHAFLTTSEMEESISVSNLDERLNETLLWHGTSREAAEKIISDDFYIPVGKAMKHAARRYSRGHEDHSALSRIVWRLLLHGGAHADRRRAATRERGQAFGAGESREARPS
eukprot:TRINITY_DN7672_c0_g1_i3.p1 TRINITY_DN7672_c0_g1~~TRINITY_DN7672_c0_g1_i3.p1  ORF type:complete len:607 (+),score=52.20 TRINITY_DN7672_c0_g1_i3:74-1894(+)